MQFLTVAVGNADLAFPEDTSLAVPFAFPQPVRRVRAALQNANFDFAPRKITVQWLYNSSAT